jgi:hypothetical protein
MKNRLEMTYSNIDKLIIKLTTEQRRRLAWKICQIIGEKTHANSYSEYVMALEALSKEIFRPDVLNSIDFLVNKLDDAHWDLHSDSNVDNTSLFRQARAAMALKYAYSEDIQSTFSDVIYEAIAATDENTINQIIEQFII